MLDRDTYVLTIRDAANRHETRPIRIRLRTLLKLMLRGFGLRCTDIRPAGTVAKPTSENITGGTVVEQYSTQEYSAADEAQTNNADRPTATFHRSG